ncbi:hypothetical protein ASE75_14575 [Sphingomonas sp. Leaf17]|uniref:DUF1491 family protein n=1 Tax=Sphingomonas sp. Leaf17 TaxID=1735683 RepID=UPI0006FC1C86|nr:DUF1491 family protein [Sphingomonas sp. Leaf17]KQM62502.1 hypothetical protein ASE75_14575 [Sphingomonas sp. Leaf17]
MSDRLPSDVVVGALLRRVNGAGGFGLVLARGDAQAGGILVVLLERGMPVRVVEHGLGPAGDTVLIDSTPEDRPHGPGGDAGDESGSAPGPDFLSAYLNRRRARDPDLWIIEVDIAAAERFAADALLGN